MYLALFVLTLLSLVFGIVGYLLIRWGRNEGRFCSIYTTGVITDIVKVQNDDGTSYAPVVEYYDDSGELIHARSSMSTGRRSVEKTCPVGKEVSVRYDPLNTNRFLIVGYDRNIPGLVGRIFLGVTAVLLTALIITYITGRNMTDPF